MAVRAQKQEGEGRDKRRKYDRRKNSGTINSKTATIRGYNVYTKKFEQKRDPVERARDENPLSVQLRPITHHVTFWVFALFIIENLGCKKILNFCKQGKQKKCCKNLKKICSYNI